MRLSTYLTTLLLGLGCGSFALASEPLAKQSAEYFRANQEVMMRFYARVEGRLPVEFRARRHAMRIPPDSEQTIDFMITNLGASDLVLDVSRSIQPGNVGVGLELLESFSDSPVRVNAGARKELRLRYRVSSALPAGIDTIQLTFIAKAASNPAAQM